METSSSNLRVCVRCNESKPTVEFAKVAKGRDGLHSYCRACMRQYMGARRKRVTHEPKPCDFCGELFTPKNVRGRFCSNNCKMRARYWRLNPPEERSCPICGEDITNRRRDTVFCSESCAQEQRRRDGRTATAGRKTDLKRKHGLTPEQYGQMIADQGGRCAICGVDDPGTHHGRWHIDHDHACCSPGNRGCGQCVRGLLCGGCNLALGHMKDDPGRLEAAAEYLRRYQR